MSPLESNLIAFLIKTTLILVAVLAGHFVLRRASAASRHLNLTLAMCGLAILPFLTLGLPAWQLEVLPSDPAPVPIVAPQLPVDLEVEAAGVQAKPPQALESERAVAGPPIQASAADPVGWSAMRWFWTAWTLGLLLVTLKLVAGLLRMRFIVRRAERVSDPRTLRLLDECGGELGLRVRPLLVEGSRGGVPLVWGWRRPVLLVPRGFTGWSTERVRTVMFHELGHIKRNDWPVLLLGRVIASLYWFHPLAWCVERCARHECERACDDLVVRCGTKPSDYAAQLISIARGESQAPVGVRAALAVVRRSQLNHRLRSILDPRPRRNAPSRGAATVWGTLALIALVPLASLQLAEEARADEPKAVQAQYEQQVDKGWTVHGVHSEGSSEGEQAYKLGYKLHGSGRYEEAAEAFEEAMELGHSPGASAYNVACCHALQGDAGRAITWLERAAEAGFDDPEDLVKDSDFDPIRSDSGFQRFVDEAFEAAEMERIDPDHYPYRATLAEFEKLKQADSTDGKAWHKLGYRLIGMRELDLAVEAFERASHLMGESKPTAMYNLACAYSLAGESRAALESLERAVDAGFDNHERFINDADLNNIREMAAFERIAEKSEFLSLGRFPRRDWEKSDYSEDRWAPAVVEYREYVGENPTSGRGWFDLGYALHFSGLHDEAVGAFEKAAGLEFRPGTSIYNAACANAKLGRTDAAIDALERSVATGAIHYGNLKGDDDLVSLRDDPRFMTLLDQLEEQEQQKKLKKQQEGHAVGIGEHIKRTLQEVFD